MEPSVEKLNAEEGKIYGKTEKISEEVNGKINEQLENCICKIYGEK